MAMALQRHQDDDRQIVSVIGDGSMTAGLAFEGMNNAGDLKPDMLVILNDNNMAIDPNVGALKEYLVDITTSPSYNRFKDDMWNLLGKISKVAPNTRKLAQKLEAGIKSTLLKHSNLFESLNFRYFGPVDGHDVIHLVKVLSDLQKIRGPKLLHVLTKKGKGYKYAEENQTVFHAPGKFNKETGEILTVTDKKKPPRFQDVFGHTVTELAEKNDKIVGITPAMPTGSSLNIMMDKMPERAYDVGIAEQHAVTFSAGLAIQGMKPFCNIYSSFMQRAYDQVIHDVALQNLPVVFCLDRGGLVGDDGATHHGAFDLAYMRIIPNMIVSAPMDEEELRNLMYTAQLKDHGPFTIRYPRGSGVKAEWKKPFRELPVGKGRLIREGNDLAILSIGHMGNKVMEACKRLEKDHIEATHYDMRFVKPLDEEILKMVAKHFRTVITVEDGCLTGGFGSAVMEYFNDNGHQVALKRLGIPDEFIEHGTQTDLHRLCGYDIEGIMNTAKSLIKKKVFSNAG
jgi:1-deoxy-D-xylulose-5-phosphate synthase